VTLPARSSSSANSAAPAAGADALRANDYGNEVAALWRLLEAASGPLVNAPPAQVSEPATGADADEAIQPDLFDDPSHLAVPDAAAVTTATILGGLVSNLTLKLDDATINDLMPPLSRTRFLSREASLHLGLQTTPAALKFVEESPSLDSSLIYHLIFEGAEPTQAALARRSDLMPEHIDALIGRPGFVVAYQLVKNRKLSFAPSQIEALTRLALKHTALRSPLIARPEFAEPEAMLLMATLGSELKSALARRFPNLDMRYPVAAGLSITTKADTAGHTDPAFLVHCLLRGHKATYARGVASRLDLQAEGLTRALEGPSLVPLALTLSALGVDRAVFNSLMRQQAHGRPAGYERLARAIFALTPAQAVARLKANPDFFKASGQ
jgi:hypothetical protein